MATITEDSANPQPPPPAPAPAPAPAPPQQQSQQQSSTPPQYPEMIMAAIEALNEKEGSNKTSISKQIESTHPDLPPAHSTLLSHHLNKMKQSGQLVLVKNNYMKPDPNAPRREAEAALPRLSFQPHQELFLDLPGHVAALPNQGILSRLWLPLRRRRQVLELGGRVVVHLRTLVRRFPLRVQLVLHPAVRGEEGGGRLRRSQPWHPSLAEWN
ncbi:hypothetical protein NC651_020641 [Populus alba x Populus x berolinensis]|nr:hypothetical protein NC651_020641 [Populus alba x Populus x berolinensis]